MIAILMALVPLHGGLADDDVPKRDALDAAVGRALFERNWVPAPASTAKTDGLGPLFNARSCAECHKSAGRGALVPDEDGWLQGAGFAVRLATESGEPDPVYGRQIQTRAVAGLPAEARVRVVWKTRTERLEDGETIELRRPHVMLSGLGYGPLSPATRVSLRVAPDLRAAARAAAVELEPSRLRFGRKATGADLADQVADALALDLGLSSSGVPNVAGDCTARQTECVAQPHGALPGGAELPDAVIGSLVTYLASLGEQDAPDARFSWPATAGADVFAAAGCAGCHSPTLTGRNGKPVEIYSDLQLHDLGEGLADPAGSPGRSAVTWRTQPLVGIGAALVQGRPLLHDGRARTVAEAIMWHGGEASDARDRYRRMDAEQRRALEEFVASRR